MSHVPWIAAFALAAAVSPASPAPAPQEGGLACVTAWPEARFRGLAYNHIVHVKNACEQAVACQVSTDVNPSPTAVTVPAGGESEVTTFLGSPARVFTPRVTCEPAK
jgi:hypothetical protein